MSVSVARPPHNSASSSAPVWMRAALDAAVRDQILVRISELWARFSDVAAGNSAAWSQQRYTAEAIRTPGPDNRWIGFPYPKLMNSNNSVEQSAALLLCSVGAAERLGVKTPLVIEDSEAGLAAARAAGFEALRVAHPDEVPRRVLERLSRASVVS